MSKVTLAVWKSQPLDQRKVQRSVINNKTQNVECCPHVKFDREEERKFLNKLNDIRVLIVLSVWYFILSSIYLCIWLVVFR